MRLRIKFLRTHFKELKQAINDSKNKEVNRLYLSIQTEVDKSIIEIKLD